jgi:hypothetical protein
MKPTATPNPSKPSHGDPLAKLVLSGKKPASTGEDALKKLGIQHADLDAAIAKAIAPVKADQDRIADGLQKLETTAATPVTRRPN